MNVIKSFRAACRRVSNALNFSQVARSSAVVGCDPVGAWSWAGRSVPALQWLSEGMNVCPGTMRASCWVSNGLTLVKAPSLNATSQYTSAVRMAQMAASQGNQPNQ